jgi:hypothetical protein
MHIAVTSFYQLGIFSKKFLSHYTSSSALSKAINSDFIVNMAIQDCLEDF